MRESLRRLLAVPPRTVVGSGVVGTDCGDAGLCVGAAGGGAGSLFVQRTNAISALPSQQARALQVGRRHSGSVNSNSTSAGQNSIPQGSKKIGVGMPADARGLPSDVASVSYLPQHLSGSTNGSGMKSQIATGKRRPAAPN
jgi:hypothetical protein